MITQADLDKALWRHSTRSRRAECASIVFVAEQMGLLLSILEAEAIWQWHSDRRAASWLMLADHPEEEIVAAITAFVELS